MMLYTIFYFYFYLFILFLVILVHEIKLNMINAAIKWNKHTSQHLKCIKTFQQSCPKT